MEELRESTRVVREVPRLVRFGSLDTPVGQLFVGLTEVGVCDVTFGRFLKQAYRQVLLNRFRDVQRDDSALSEVITQLADYFSGERRSFSVAVDLRAVTPFTARVLRETRKIKFGRLTCYGQLAIRLGNSGASRAVGSALGRNPVPILIPCHRVVRRNGGMGGFMAGLETKRVLLDLEGHFVSEPSPKFF